MNQALEARPMTEEVEFAALQSGLCHFLDEMKSVWCFLTLDSQWILLSTLDPTYLHAPNSPGVKAAALYLHIHSCCQLFKICAPI